MKPRDIDRFAYNGLTTSEFGKRTGMGAGQVRELIAKKWFRVMPDGIPECVDIRVPGKGQPTYRIHPKAVDRFFRERAA